MEGGGRRVLFETVPYSDKAIRSMNWKQSRKKVSAIVVLRWVGSQICLQPLSPTRMSLLKMWTLVEAREASLTSWEQTIHYPSIWR